MVDCRLGELGFAGLVLGIWSFGTWHLRLGGLGLDGFALGRLGPWTSRIGTWDLGLGTWWIGTWDLGLGGLGPGTSWIGTLDLMDWDLALGGLGIGTWLRLGLGLGYRRALVRCCVSPICLQQLHFQNYISQFQGSKGHFHQIGV